MRRNARGVEYRSSPLDYGLRPGLVQRLALIDDEAPHAVHHYFDPVMGKTNAFIDFTKVAPDQMYINFMSTRPDYRGQGIARDMLHQFMAFAEHSGISLVNFGHVMEPTIWNIYTDLKNAHRAGESAVDVHGKIDF